VFIIFKLLSFTLLPVALNSETFLSPIKKTITINNPFPDSLEIIDKNVNIKSIKIFSDKELIKDIDYSILSYILKEMVVMPDFVDSNLFTTVNFIKFHYNYQHESMKLEYELFPDYLYRTFSLYEPFDLSDSTKTTSIKPNWESAFYDNHNLNITGSKTISITTSNQDFFDLNQSLFLRIDGELAQNVYILAQLNDSKSKITQDGDSKELSALDEVFFKVYGKEYEIALGDLDFTFIGSQFINYTPKFQGLRMSYFEKNKISGAIALSEGESSYITFTGIEGKQGPYYLKPTAIHQNVRILSGTENIWLNGVLLKRGNDYRIDYNEGSIEFYLKHFISGNSRIQASFQYSDENYRKETLLNKTELNITDKLQIKSAIIIQTDDKNNPLSESLSAIDKELLKSAGNNKIYVTGEVFIGDGYGLYRKIIIPLEYGEQKIIYEYAFRQPDADYNVTFTWVGEGNGEYRQVTPSRFDFVGEKNGSFLPIKEIVPPQHKANYDFSTTYKQDSFSLYIESLISEYDTNTFSKLGDKENISHIHHIQANLHPDYDTFNPDLNIWYRYKHRNLYTFVNIKKADEAFMFYTFPDIDSLNANEFNINFKTLSYNLFSQTTNYKLINYDNIIKQNQISLYQRTNFEKKYPEFRYNYHFAKYKNDFLLEQAKITIHEPETQYEYKAIAINANIRKFQSTLTNKQTNEILEGNKLDSYYGEIALLEINNSGIAFSKKLEQSFIFWNHDEHQYQSNNSTFVNRSDAILSTWEKQSESNTWTIKTYSRLKNHYITTLYSHRIVNTYLNAIGKQKFDIAESMTQSSLWNKGIQLSTAYTLKNIEFFPKSRELIYVGKDAGSYDSTGVWVDKGDFEWDVAIVGEPIKSIEVHANLNTYLYPANFVKRENDLYELLSKINSETNISISEQTENSQRRKVYLLLPSAIMNEFSIYSRQEIRQTIWYNITKNKMISRYSFRTDKTQDKRYQDLQSLKISENEFSLRLLKVYYSDFEAIIRFRNENDSRYDMKTDTKSHELFIRTSYDNNLIFTTGLGYEKEDVLSHGFKQIIDRYMFSEDIVYFLGFKYRFNSTFSLKYNEVKDTISTYIPYEKLPGFNSNWSTGIEYRQNQIFSLNLDYSGHKYVRQEIFHQIKMEAKAEF